MIKFFRKIRLKLLKEGKAKRYLIYAFGEIVLVIVGILIALLINDWRNDLNIQKDEKKILESLDVEFSDAKVSISEFIQSSEDIIATNKQFLSYCVNINKDFEESTFDSLLYNAAWNASLRLNQGVFKELLNTGNLSKISNSKLRVLLSSWDGLLEALRNSEKVAADYLASKLVNYLDQNISMTIMAKYDKTGVKIPQINDRIIDRKNLAKDIELENFIYNQIWFSHSKVKVALELIALNIEILDEIQKSK